MNPRRKKRLTLVLALVVGLGATIGFAALCTEPEYGSCSTPRPNWYRVRKMAPSRKWVSVYVLAAWWWRVRLSRDPQSLQVYL